MLFVNEGFTFRNFLVDAITVFVFVVAIWLLITVFMDLFRRHDISGWGKAFWVIGLLIFPLLAVLVYLITQGRGMAERNAQQAQQARDELRRVVGFGAADEVEKLDRLKKAGSITEAEFTRLRAKLVQWLIRPPQQFRSGKLPNRAAFNWILGCSGATDGAENAAEYVVAHDCLIPHGVNGQ